jgi:predicted AlkP superfamily pyrophosphatase or phosphodiesterase
MILLMAISTFFFTQGIFLRKKIIELKTPAFNTDSNQTYDYPHTKVIVILVDAFREDFFEIDDNNLESKMYLDHKNSNYLGKKIKLFNELMTKEPNNTIILPFATEIPTVTAVRVRCLLTGALNAYIEVTENFYAEKINEDNVIY